MKPFNPTAEFEKEKNVKVDQAQKKPDSPVYKKDKTLHQERQKPLLSSRLAKV